MFNTFIILLGKFLSKTFQILHLGNGSTWPGHIALKLNNTFIRDVLDKSGTKIIIIAGTNGKTTTSKMIADVLREDGKKILLNISGANLLNGIASSILLQSTMLGRLKKDYAILEVDENALQHIINEITPDYIVLLNLFRDQLDRYGEVNSIAKKWTEIVTKLPDTTHLIINADDPQIAYIGIQKKTNVTYFSVKGNTNTHVQEHAVDSIYCPRCGNRLDYTSITFSHLGMWHCSSCRLKTPTASITSAPFYPLPGEYNKYNIHAVITLSKVIGIDNNNLQDGLKKFTPVFGRQEKILLNNKYIQIFLSKNPTGLNESLKTVRDLGAKHILFVLNDNIADGKDVSWIWDTDIENILTGNEKIYTSGTRAYDIAVRLKYTYPITNDSFEPCLDLEKSIHTILSQMNIHETLFILPTYTAMLETRKIITGKKIL